jgi:hypothetical protein
MTDISISSHEAGRVGRPLSPAKRRSRLRMHFIRTIGLENIDSVMSEQILAAVELTCMAAEQRAKITKTGAASAEDLLAIVRLENAAARAVARLPLPVLRGTSVQPDTIDTHAAV